MADVLPEGIFTDPGSVTLANELESATTRPLEGATDVIDTVPVLVFPPFTLAGLTVTALSSGGEIVSLAVTEAPFEVPVRVASDRLATGWVFIVNVAVVLPDAIATDEGTDADFKLLDSLTKKPLPAGLLIVSVP